MRYLALLLGCCCVIWVQCLSCGTFAQIRVGDAAFGLISPARLRPMTCGSAASARRLMSNPPLWSVRGGSLPSVVRDGAVSALILTESYVWLKLWSGAAANGRLHSNVTRKIIHATSAPLFLLHWPLFSRSPTARFFAAAVPLVQAARLVHAVSKSSRTGKGTNAHIIASTDEDLVKGMSRSGSEAEIWGGPFLYTLVLLVTTLTLFRTPAAVVALCQLAVGDGLSDLVGRKFGRKKWWFAKTKSLVGSAAFLAGGFLSSLLCLLWLDIFDPVVRLTIGRVEGIRLFTISLVCAMAELLPRINDNLSVPLFAAVLAWLFLPHALQPFSV